MQITSSSSFKLHQIIDHRVHKSSSVIFLICHFSLQRHLLVYFTITQFFFSFKYHSLQLTYLLFFLQSETNALKPVYKRPCPTDDNEPCPEGIDDVSDDEDSDYGDEDDSGTYSSTTPKLTPAKPTIQWKKMKPKSPLRHFLLLMSCCVAD